MISPFYDSMPILFDNAGVPLVGRVSFYENGSSTFAEAYLDADGNTIAPNPMRTNGHGRLSGQVFLPCDSGDSRRYRVVVEKYIGEFEEDMDEYWDDPSFWVLQYEYLLVFEKDNPYSGVVVDSTSGIASAPTSFGYLFVSGFYSAGDSPARIYRYVSDISQSDIDGITKIRSTVVNDGGAWVWSPDTVIDARTFGVVRNRSQSEIDSAFAALESYLGNPLNDAVAVTFPAGTFSVRTSFAVENVDVKLDEDCVLQGNSVTISCRTFAGATHSLDGTFRLKVSEGDYRLSWFSGIVNIDVSFGTPDVFRVDEAKYVDGANFFLKDCLVVGDKGITVNPVYSATLSHVSVETNPLFSILPTGLFVHDCTPTRLSAIYNGDFPSRILANSTGTRFIADEPVDVQGDIDIANVLELTSDSSFSSGSGYSVRLHSGDIPNGILDCYAKFPEPTVIHRKWFSDNEKFISSLGFATAPVADLDGLVVSSDTALPSGKYVNGSISSTVASTGDYVFENVTFSNFGGVGIANSISAVRSYIESNADTLVADFCTVSLAGSATYSSWVLRHSVVLGDVSLQGLNGCNFVVQDSTVDADVTASATSAGSSFQNSTVKSFSGYPLSVVSSYIGSEFFALYSIDGAGNITKLVKDDGTKLVTLKGVDLANGMDSIDFSTTYPDFARCPAVIVYSPYNTTTINIRGFNSANFPALRAGTLLLITKCVKDLANERVFLDGTMSVEYSSYRAFDSGNSQFIDGDNYFTYSVTSNRAAILFVCLEPDLGYWVPVKED